MSSITESSGAGVPDRSIAPGRSEEAGDRMRGWISFVVTGVVVAFSVVEVINLGLKHTTGAELYGVLVAILAVGAGVASLSLLRSSRTLALATAVVLVLWAVIALAGIVGVVAHIVGPVPGQGLIDLRPRPIAAPLVFTVIAIVGAAALFLGKQAASRRARDLREE